MNDSDPRPVPYGEIGEDRTMDASSGAAIRALAEAFGRAHNELREGYESGQTKAAVDLLDSDAPLSRAFRTEVAELLRGNLGRERGARGAIVPPQIKAKARRQISHYKEEARKQGKPDDSDELYERAAEWWRGQPEHHIWRINGSQMRRIWEKPGKKDGRAPIK